jgi:hypothetical protein
MRATAKQSEHVTLDELFIAAFSMRYVPRLHKESIWRCELCTRVEEGSNISTVTLRVIGGNEKWNPVPGVEDGGGPQKIPFILVCCFHGNVFESRSNGSLTKNLLFSQTALSRCFVSAGVYRSVS